MSIFRRGPTEHPLEVGNIQLVPQLRKVYTEVLDEKSL